MGHVARTQSNQTVRNMLWSMVVISLCAGAFYIFVPHDETKTPVKRVDYRVELLTARRAAAYPVAAPEGLAHAWKPTSVRYDGAKNDSWHLGFLDPDGEYVAIKQSTAKPTEFIREATERAEKTKVTEEIGGRTWQRYKGGTYDALVSRDKGATTVVAGTASFGQLEKMVKALKTS
ncbi:DUF4245 domain-containing protein [Streptomyces sp. MZ04]|uniref:DUF4245 domain-containing protein n=1 Tax=Streptomyces sp. MZ04 TaxID=2559236 RepID=UPI00107EDECF|nr:DUF4245 domain-containing protein [Streptomyces sp. MZ04]TGB06628.1 DUF4245 domain-containing protein [Streptomyces sp. MZ04]